MRPHLPRPLSACLRCGPHMILCILEMVNVVLRPRATAAAASPRPAPLFDGTRRADWTERPELARRLGAVLAARGEVAYCVARPDTGRALAEA